MARNKILINKNPIFEKCPKCHETGTLHRSRARNLRENILKMIPLWSTYRCKSCGWRGYRFIFTLTFKSFKTLFFYALLILIAAYIVKFALSKFIH